MNFCLRDLLALLTGMVTVPAAGAPALSAVADQGQADRFFARGRIGQTASTSGGLLSLWLSRIARDCSLTNKCVFFYWEKNTLPCSLTGRNL